MESKIFWFAVLFAINTELEAKLRTWREHHGGNQESDCSDAKVKEDFDYARFHGTWYEVFAYPFTLTAGSQCVSFTFSQAVDEKFRFMSKCMKNGMPSQVMGMGELAAPGVMTLLYPAYPACSGFNTEVIDTDYENFAVLAACNNLCSSGIGQNVWILSRRTQLEPVYGAKAMKTLSDNGINMDLLERTVQNCN